MAKHAFRHAKFAEKSVNEQENVPGRIPPKWGSIIQVPAPFLLLKVRLAFLQWILRGKKCRIPSCLNYSGYIKSFFHLRNRQLAR